jgi:CDP-paratose 2-epimerase
MQTNGSKRDASARLPTAQQTSSNERGWRSRNKDSSHILITGGAGFVGTNLADRLLSQGRRVLIFDNLSRSGVKTNLAWLRTRYPDRLTVQLGDLRNEGQIAEAVRRAGAVFHFAAQVAVTTSVADPQHDFAVNAQGTLNLLEAVRRFAPTAPVFFTSTNKVYGDLADIPLVSDSARYEPQDETIRQYGVDEDRSLSFHGPYGCSKGVADQYILDYCRTFELQGAVFRMSCIYGPHQFGNEDQGWVAHFILRALQGQPITLYGDGKQVRDILFVDDLVDAFLWVHAHIDQVSGEAFNIGGGPANRISLLELIDLIEELQGRTVEFQFGDWRSGDQRYYVSDVRKFTAAAGWRPQVDVVTGVHRLYRWLREHRAPNAQPQVARWPLVTTTTKPGDSPDFSRKREAESEQKYYVEPTERYSIAAPRR